MASVSAEFVAKLAGSDVILLTHQPDKSWLNAVASLNISFISVTLEVFHPPIFWLNDDEPFFDSQELFTSERFPNLVITNNGTLIATWGSSKVIAKRSIDGGKSWGNEIIIANPGFHGGGTLVDDVTGNIFVFVEEGHPVSPIQIYISEDDGKSWKKHQTIILITSL